MSMRTSQPVGDLVHLPVLQRLPEQVRRVEEQSLQQQHERHPLVVRKHMVESMDPIIHQSNAISE